MERSTCMSFSPAIERPGAALADQYRTVRAFTEKICAPLVTEDYAIQSMPDCSPAKWHLAHTSWFFETFVLKAVDPDYRSPHPQYDFLFNSYYNSVGDRHCRAKRGLISRPTVAETYTYRAQCGRSDARLFGERRAGADRRHGIRDRDRPAPRTAASRIDDHRPQTYVLRKSPAADLPPRRRGSRGTGPRTALDRVRRRSGLDRPRRPPASPTTTRDRATRRFCSRSNWRRA